MLTAAVAATALTAALASTASADDGLSVGLDAGVLSITGDEGNAVASVFKQPSASSPGGYVLTVSIVNNAVSRWPVSCSLGGTFGKWLVTCPALNVSKITFDGKLGGNGFFNNTGLPSEAHGGPGVDDFHGGTGPDVFYGDADNDILAGNGGDDTLDGGAGTDTVSGGPGTDFASWADATDPVTASLDGVANDGVAGENENVPADVEGLRGGLYGDKLSGDQGPNTLAGGDGPDDLDGGGGDDMLGGQAGDDTLHPNSGADALFGGTDRDTLSYAGYGQSVYVYQDGAANDGALGEHDNVISVENLTGSAATDDLEGTPGDDVIHGGNGFDKIDAKFGDDVVYGGDGPDNLIGGPGAPTECGQLGCTKFDTDQFYGGSGRDTIDYTSRSEDLKIALDGSSKSGGVMENDTLTSIEDANGGSGNDTIYGNQFPNSLTGNAGADGIDGEGANDDLDGGLGNDWLGGGPGDDYVDGGQDNDTLDAVGGNDTLYGAGGRDRVSYLGANSGVIAHIGTGTSGPTGEYDKIDADVEDLEGSVFSDKLYGNGSANLLIGHAGKDVLVGNGGADTLKGDEGADTLNTNGDAVADHSDCGVDTDIANADKIDSVNANCETINKT